MPEIALWPSQTHTEGSSSSSSSASDPKPRVLEIQINVRKKVIPQPKTIKVGTLFDDRLRLKKALSVKIEKQGTSYVAICEDFDEYGCGDHLFDAVDDLRMMLTELYWGLKQQQAGLGQDLGRLWQSLQSVIGER